MKFDNKNAGFMEASKLEILENRIRNTKTEFYLATVAVFISFIYRSLDESGLTLQRLFYVVIVYFIHMIVMAYIFDKWHFNHLYVLSRHWVRIISSLVVLIFSYFDLKYIEIYYNPLLIIHKNGGDNYRTLMTIVIYCSIYYCLILIKYNYEVIKDRKGKK